MRSAVLKAHGHKPQWVKGKQNQLAPESQAAYRAIDLHFHDLRREFASRLLESGASQHVVRDFLGHASITTTSRYLATTPVVLEKAMHSFERHRQNATSEESAANSPEPSGDSQSPIS
jgi:site-specific recombinase XerD